MALSVKSNKSNCCQNNVLIVGFQSEVLENQQQLFYGYYGLVTIYLCWDIVCDV